MARCIVLRLVKRTSCLGMGLLLLIVMLQVGCKRSTTVVGQKGEKATVTQEGDNIEVAFKGQNGEIVHFAGGKNAVALPAEFPADVAIYPKAIPVTTSTAGTEMTVMFRTSDSLQKVVVFYKAQLKEKGWKIKTATDIPEASMLEGEKDGRKLTVWTAEQQDGTIINLVVSSKK